MKIFVGADHGGVALKQMVVKWVAEAGYEVEDCGAVELNADDDYPGFAFKVAHRVREHAGSRGILICRSGGGMAIAANKVPGIRAVVVASVREVEHAVTDNDANVITLAADWLEVATAQEIVKTFLVSQFSQAERHVRRLQQIADYELKK